MWDSKGERHLGIKSEWGRNEDHLSFGSIGERSDTAYDWLKYNQIIFVVSRIKPFEFWPIGAENDGGDWNYKWCIMLDLNFWIHGGDGVDLERKQKQRRSCLEMMGTIFGATGEYDTRWSIHWH